MIIISILTILNNKECTKRIIPIYNSTVLIDNDYLKQYLEKKKLALTYESAKEHKKYTDGEIVGGGALSAGIYYQSFHIGINSFIKNPFGVGINQYKHAYDDYYKENIVKSYNWYLIDDLNRNDASNNFIKIIVEFGIFGFLFYLIIFLALISKKIDLNLKIFLITIIFTQSIRGAGYFNGGFVLAAFLIIVLYFKKDLHEKKMQ